MDVFYINLEAQADRRGFVEDNFAASNNAGWRLHRVAGIEAQSMARDGVPGRLRDTEKACFLAHCAAVAAAATADGHALIAEDDIEFGQRTMASVDNALKAIADTAWDVIFTDAIIPEAQTMLHLFRLRQQCVATGQAHLLDLTELSFCGAISYIVNRRAKQKLLQALQQSGPLDAPYDIRLRQLILNRTLRGFILFPFVTTQSLLGMESQIQPTAQKAAGQRIADAAWVSFRRLTWQERDIGQAMAVLDRAGARGDADSISMSHILAVMMTETYRP